MRGVVEVYRGDEKILEEPNMIMDNMGSQIAFWMSLPRGFGDIASASAIYDTSNYNVRAASLGKDAAGYSHHAHRPQLSASSSPSDRFVRVLSYGPVDSSAYKTEEFSTFYDAAASALRTRFKVLPEDSHPRMQRLESKSTAVAVAGSASTIDVGHNLNRMDEIEALGCYAPPGEFNVVFKILSSLPEGNNIIAERRRSNTDGFNCDAGIEAKSLDKNGFIRVTVDSIAEGKSLETSDSYFRGLLLSYDDLNQAPEAKYAWDPPTNRFSLKHVIGLRPQDFLCLNFFGGVYTIGLWGFDIEGMIKKGKYPPYSDYPVDGGPNSAEYKLFARKTFNKDITSYERIQSVNLQKIIWRFNFP